MNLQPLYDVKERLEYAAIAGTGLLGEDFRLQRAAEGLKPLAAASPVFAKIDSGLQKLLNAPAQERSGLLLDTLALVDAVAYTQAGTGGAGELEPLDAGGGVYHPISYGQINPLLTALTTTGGGRMETIQSTWENHPEFFEDYRVLPAVVAGLGDSYGEISELNAGILKQIGPAALPMLKRDFDPAGKREMARRVEVISAIGGADAAPWLREVLPEAKKDVRAAVITALGESGDSAVLLLDLAKTERGKNRDAALQALALQDGDEVRTFWETELVKNPQAVVFLRAARTDWASDLVAVGLRERLEKMLTDGGRVPSAEQEEFSRWCQAIGQKSSPAMLDFWRWADSHMETFDEFTNEKGNPVFVGVRLTDSLRDALCGEGPGPLSGLCTELWERHKDLTRGLMHGFFAALLTRPAAEVYDKFSPYIRTKKPVIDAKRKETLNTVLLRALGEVYWDQDSGRHILTGGHPTAEPLDRRWIERLTQAVYTDMQGKGGSPFAYYWENVSAFDLTLMRLADPADGETRRLLIPYLRKRLEKTGLPYHYSRWLFCVGGSPKGLLGSAMERNPKSNHLYVVWNLMFEASKVLPAGEVADLLEEISISKGIYKNAQAKAELAIPWTIEQLRAGKPLPSWDEWVKL